MKKYSAKLKFWGVRGSIPVPGNRFARYGGNTSCVELRCGETFLILDAGTGIRPLGLSYLKEFGSNPVHLNILISHSHWDHLQGFPFLSHIYIPGNSVTFYGGHTVNTLEKLVMTQLSEEFHPKQLYELSADINFVELKRNDFQINDVKILFTHLLHPGLSLGYRISYKGYVFAYVTDNEILADEKMAHHNWENIGSLIYGADVVIHDAQYTDEEYKNKLGWGHSSIENVVKICNKFRVKKLFTFHHDPLHTDRDVGKMVARARKLANKDLKVFGAREGQELFFK
ncbi:MAG: MBL fold metallo-hydrolase [Spirochaetes bacterium]|jgi:phosphoribosyl 1,2-cyclic phosphodiesterase|nr:MBL fold metallo-hydrolase [Spirochaetota bacterium]